MTILVVGPGLGFIILAMFVGWQVMLDRDTSIGPRLKIPVVLSSASAEVVKRENIEPDKTNLANKTDEFAKSDARVIPVMDKLISRFRDNRYFELFAVGRTFSLNKHRQLVLSTAKNSGDTFGLWLEISNNGRNILIEIKQSLSGDTNYIANWLLSELEIIQLEERAESLIGSTRDISRKSNEQELFLPFLIQCRELENIASPSLIAGTKAAVRSHVPKLLSVDSALNNHETAKRDIAVNIEKKISDNHTYQSRGVPSSSFEKPSKEDISVDRLRPVPFMLCLSLLLLMKGAVSMPAMIVFGSEKDKRTLLTTMTLPVSLETILTGKAIAVCSLTMIHPMLFLLVLICLLLLILNISPDLGFAPELQLEFASSCLISFSVLVFDTIATIFVFFLLIAIGRTVNQTNIFIFICSGVMVLMLIIARLPQISHSLVYAFIPFFNSSLFLNSVYCKENSGLFFIITILANLFYSILLIKLCKLVLSKDVCLNSEAPALLEYLRKSESKSSTKSKPEVGESY